jgi:peroxiredoxin
MGGRMKTLIMGFLMAGFLMINPANAQFFMFENENIGQDVVNFELPLASGGKSTLNDYRNGKPAMIFFWATWCPHCRTQLSHLNKIHSQLESEGIKVVLVDLGEPASKVNAFFKKNNITLDVFLDQDSSVAEKYEIIGVPTFFLVSADGKIRAVEHEIPENYIEILRQ